MLIKAAVLTASDRCSRGERQDKSGALLKSMLEKLPAQVIHTQVLPDDTQDLREAMIFMSDELGCDLILTTGGTGLSPRDQTPEATRQVIEREIPGIAEAIRQESIKKKPVAMLSRGVAGVRGRTLIVNLPGSPRAAQETFRILKPVLNHAIELIKEEAPSHTHSRFLR